ncbi:unnamed protein product [Penicillium salamii]|uniref:Protein kinase domain-containing protein n=1 Tax=Penicillium salamii TaxID=1612424 RepID=A0A9W4J4A7_9EURO|nr:unnamed protein product [Penicillium salamii]
MSGLEIGLALPGIIDLCLKYGDIIVTKYKDFKQADTEIEEHKLVIEAAWIKTSEQLAFLRRVWDQLGDDYRDLQFRILRVFESKLESAVLELSTLDRPSTGTRGRLSEKSRAAKYALLKKEALDKAVRDLQTWQKEFDTTWLKVLLIPDAFIDEALVKRTGTEKLSTARHLRSALHPEQAKGASVFLSESLISSAQYSEIPFSTSQVIDIADQGAFILDSADCSSRSDASAFAKNVRHLALKLNQIDESGFHLLKCHRVVRRRDPNENKKIRSFDFILKFPEGCHKPQSLRSRLLSREKHTLSERVSMAHQLATSINNIHTLDFVHKNIRPETVLVFEDSALYLLGFSGFRLADNKSLRLGNSILSENIYQHPDRQGSTPDADYVMQHDIYSLGVCLLEIGLWEPFVDRDGHTSIPLSDTSSDPSSLVRDRSLKGHFVDLARERLPVIMGDRYTQVVVNCLSCLDETNPDFGDQSEFEDDDGILIGVKYIEKVQCFTSIHISNEGGGFGIERSGTANEVLDHSATP